KVNAANGFSQVGEIVAEHDVAVIAETQGKVTAVMAEVGDYISAGTAIVKVDDELPKAKFLAVKTNYEKAKKDYERFKVLLKEDIISDSQFETSRLAYEAAEAEFTAARRDYKNAVITAPISGLITIRPVTFGTMIAPGMVVANIVDISKLKIRVNLAERDVFRLKAGDPAVITTDVYPTIKFKGQVKSISVKGDEAHTFTVETLITYQKEHQLKSGMFGRVTFYQPTDAPVLIIPREALIGSIKNAQVYVIKNNIAHLRDIVVGQDSGTGLVVLQGLNEGEQVVISGQDNLEDNSQVSVKSNRQRGDRDDLN
ncbi:MAG TPA: efflux RND transporter periplasmic adaptor subunit, partial [Bacillota bacterium]|nr:efflux RND transporter periplasmic adaptor subunit [Bacillota bacterium]